jgi:glycosyltransferase involved in cell wall biosynthesis
MPHADRPRVAVIVPCFDDGRTLGATVASVLSQDEPVELVVVDDGSKDPATLLALERLAEGGVRVLRQENAGPAHARTAGLQATVAPFVLPLDADDVLLPGAVAFLADLLEAHSGAGAAWGWYQRVGDETTLQPTAPSLDAWQITYMNELPSTALLRRTALDELGGWSSDGGYEDWALWLGLAERGWTGIGTNRVIYEYRREGVRRGHRDARRHGETHDQLRAAHASLFADRGRNWRHSAAPLALRLALPTIEAVPGLSRHHRRALGGVASHLAHRRGVGRLARRARESSTAFRPGDQR